MNISNYADLLTAARQQPEPQRLFFVFTQPELPEGYAAAQNKGFQDGTGGVLTPQMCTDKALDELGDFADLVEESRHMGQDWKIVFVACLAGHAGGDAEFRRSAAPQNDGQFHPEWRDLKLPGLRPRRRSGSVFLSRRGGSRRSLVQPLPNDALRMP